MNLRRTAALGAVATLAILLCSYGAPSFTEPWSRGTTQTGKSLSGSEPATDTISTYPVSCLMAQAVYWEVWGDSVKLAAPNIGEVPFARCSVVAVQVSMSGHDTSWVTAGTELTKVDSLTTRDINAQHRWVRLVPNDAVSVQPITGIPWAKARLVLQFYGAHAKNLRNLYVTGRVYQ